MSGPIRVSYTSAVIGTGAVRALLISSILAGCGQTAPYFVPQTAVGAQCAEECQRSRRSCHRTPESSADCERVNAQCIADCKQFEREMIVD